MQFESEQKYLCTECGKICYESETLVAENPFDIFSIITGCPHCQSVESLEGACSVKGCNNVCSMGVKWPDGEYRRTCGSGGHRPG